MPKVRHRKAAKDYPEIGVKKGEMYYTWKLRTGPRSSRKFRSKTPPKPQQLTTSEFAIAVSDIEDAIRDASDHSDLEQCAQDIEDLGQEQSDKLDNMPEGLQQGDTGQLLQERADECETWAQTVRDAASELSDKLSNIDDDEDLDEEAKDAARDEALEEAKAAAGEDVPSS